MKTKLEKRAEAEGRNASYQALSKKEKIELAKARRGGSKKELERLESTK